MPRKKKTAEPATLPMTPEVNGEPEAQEPPDEETLPRTSDWKCRVCGCTDENCSQCIEKTGEACSWVEKNLCSACAPEDNPADDVEPTKEDCPPEEVASPAPDKPAIETNGAISPLDRMKLAAFDQAAELTRQLQTQRGVVKECEEAVKGAKADLEEAENDFEVLQARLAATISEVKEAVHVNGYVASRNTPLYPLTDAQATADNWQNVALQEALQGLKPNILKKLADANLLTMGELAAWTAADQGKKRITDVPGIGEASAMKIEEACTAFWARRNAAPVAAAPAEVAAPDSEKPTPIFEVLFSRLPADKEDDLVEKLKALGINTHVDYVAKLAGPESWWRENFTEEEDDLLSKAVEDWEREQTRPASSSAVVADQGETTEA